MDFPSWGFRQAAIEVYTAASITSGAVNTKGSWTQVVASTNKDAGGLLFHFQYATALTGTYNSYLVDVGFGGSGSEVAVINNIVCTNAYYHRASSMGLIHLPIAVPAGTRIAMRSQANVATSAMDVKVSLARGALGLGSLYRCTTLGAQSSGQSRGTSVDPGASAGSFGSWTEFTSSMAHDVKHVMAILDYRNNAAMTNGYWRFQIGIGSAGSEQPMYECWAGMSDSEQISPLRHSIPMKIPAGTRVAVRAACQHTDATDRLAGVTLYCFG